MTNLRRSGALAAALALAAAPAAADFTINGPTTYDSGVFSNIGARVSAAPVPGLTPGSYTNSDITVDEYGRVTLAASGGGGCTPPTATAVMFSAAGPVCSGDVANFFYSSTNGLLTVVSKNQFGVPQAGTFIGGDGSNGGSVVVSSNYDADPSGTLRFGYNLLNNYSFLQSLSSASNPDTLALNWGGGTVAIGSATASFVSQPAGATTATLAVGAPSTWLATFGSSGAYVGGIYSNANQITEFIGYDFYNGAVERLKLSGDPASSSIIPNRLTVAG